MTGELMCITYGHIVDPGKFVPAYDGRGSYLNKPEGGLWCSPENSSDSWKDWCEKEDFGTGRLKTWTRFKVLEGTKLLVIDSFKDLMEALLLYSRPSMFCDGGNALSFNKIRAAGYRGVYLTENGNIECHPFRGMNVPNLNAWDCESLVLFDLDCIEIIETSE